MNTHDVPARVPHVKYLIAAGLLGFVLGAFVVASLGTGSPLRTRAERDASKTTIGAVDAPSANAIVEVPAPTSGKSGIIPPGAPEARDLAARQLTTPVQGISAAALVRSYHDAR